MLAIARIMVVEDETMIALDLQNMLKSLGPGYNLSDPASFGAGGPCVGDDGATGVGPDR